MSLLSGILRAEDSTKITDLDVREVASAVGDVFAKYDELFNLATTLFVSETITYPTEHIDQTGIDEGQDVDRYGRALETRVIGGYDVAYPWVRRGWAHGWDREGYPYLTVGDVAKITTAQTRGNRKWRLRSIFRALFNNVNYTFNDMENKGTALTIRALANQDGTLFPASEVLSMAESTAQANHYIVSNYVSSSMSGTNNPLALIRAKLRVPYPEGERIVAFINSAQLADIRAKLPNFFDANTVDVTLPNTAQEPIQISGINVPGTYVGVDGDTNVHVFTYDSSIPADYIYGQVAGLAPLKRRIPTVAELQGFRLEAEEDFYPLHRREFRDRQGYAPGNRLSAAIVQLKASGSYDVPAIYKNPAGL